MGRAGGDANGNSSQFDYKLHNPIVTPTTQVTEWRRRDRWEGHVEGDENMAHQGELISDSGFADSTLIC